MSHIFHVQILDKMVPQLASVKPFFTKIPGAAVVFRTYGYPKWNYINGV